MTSLKTWARIQKNIYFSKNPIGSFNCEDNKTCEAQFMTVASAFGLFDNVSSQYEERVKYAKSAVWIVVVELAGTGLASG
jgi:hypothetical protein